jgi:hypothetical protein
LKFLQVGVAPHGEAGKVKGVGQKISVDLVREDMELVPRELLQLKDFFERGRSVINGHT